MRQSFQQQVSESPDLFDAVDVAKVASDDWTVDRFIGLKKHDLDAASAALVKAMKWRQEMSVSSIRETDFPAEFFWTGETHEYVRDRNNCAMMYARVKFHKQLTEFTPISKRYLIYLIERMEEEVRTSGANGWALIYDCDGGTIFNNNMDLLFFMIQAIFEYYPLSLTYIGLYNLPWVLRAIYHVCRGWIPEEFRNVLHFVNASTIQEYVGRENLPAYLGGTCTLLERRRMPDNPSIKQFVKEHGLKESAVGRFFSHYQRFLDMGDRAELLQQQERAAAGKGDQVVSGNNNHQPITTSA